ncbi:hypothetical protein PAECIP111802_00410 [Paenibacillus allorhizosphaerae]|uniref:DUF3231 family protein n=2 Tax=Paenibacillus allorhizosphaerae TaxID=2849866 RepID=A0ABN7THJ3_9BACL|nr:hypothetical protein PAECIP111802_00410 [Paenibacillus allorhizosphaerae]
MQYMNETASLYMNKFLLQNLNDDDIRAIYEYAVHLGEQHVEKIQSFFESESYPIPEAFTEQDVSTKAPKMFSDPLALHYLNIMSIHGCHGYSGAITTSSRKDVREYFSECLASSVKLCNWTKDLLIDKGIYFRPPAITPPERPEFVQSKSFVAGLIGEKRPLTCIEITDILFNLKKSILAKAVLVAFHQVGKSSIVKRFLLEAIEVKEKHIETFAATLDDDNLPAPPTLESEITDTMLSPFSDRLMMFQVGFLFSSAMVYYGSGLASSPRKDLVAKYMMAIGDDMKVSANWLRVMTDHGWMEQPPLTENRKALAMASKA